MKAFCKILSIILVSIINCHAQQHSTSIPLQKDIDITLTSRDTALLGYYNIYGFQYIQASDTLQAEFLVPKQKDVYAHKLHITAALCIVSEFITREAGVELPAMKMIDNIELTSGEKKVFLNFDPAGPEPVYCLCGEQPPATGNN